MPDPNSIVEKGKNALIVKRAENPANPGYPINADRQDYPPNTNIDPRNNNPTNPGYPINAARY